MATSAYGLVSLRLVQQGGFLAFWQVQSKLGALALFALLAVSVWLALVVIMLWSIAATFTYYAARQRGVPDVLSLSRSRSRATRTGYMLGSVWLVGVSAFAFANVLRPLLRQGSTCRRSRLTRGAALAAGLTLFGVTMNQHLLQAAGFQGPKLLAVSMLGTFLNVPYRIFCGALTLELLLSLMRSGLPSSYV